MFEDVTSHPTWEGPFLAYLGGGTPSLPGRGYSQPTWEGGWSRKVFAAI